LNDALSLFELPDDEYLAPATSLLRTAVETLAEATGAQYTDSLLDTIFSRFCIGK
jgi:tRNA U34 5-carboxymethylaminomethyl modifying GTPase MnmE/TrmE